MPVTFKSFLKAFGEDVAKIASSVMGGTKVVIEQMNSIPAVVSDIKALIDLIKKGEGMFAAAGLAKSGPQKLMAIQPYTAAILSDVEVIGGTKLGSIIKDEAAFNQGVADLNTALVKILNSCGQ
jgi:hypothetical protein